MQGLILGRDEADQTKPNNPRIFVEKNCPPLDTYYVLHIRFFWKNNNEVCVQEGLDVTVSVSLLSGSNV